MRFSSLSFWYMTLAREAGLTSMSSIPEPAPHHAIALQLHEIESFSRK
jgi:hypothetical protein